MRHTINRFTAAAVVAAFLVMTTAGVASAWATKASDKALTGAELKALIVGKHLNYVYSKPMKQKGVVSYGKDGHYTVDFDNAGTLVKWGGLYRITDDGQVCTTRDGVDSGESCQLFVMDGKKLTMLDSMEGRYVAKITN